MGEGLCWARRLTQRIGAAVVRVWRVGYTDRLCVELAKENDAAS